MVSNGKHVCVEYVVTQNLLFLRSVDELLPEEMITYKVLANVTDKPEYKTYAIATNVVTIL